MSVLSNTDLAGESVDLSRKSTYFNKTGPLAKLLTLFTCPFLTRASHRHIGVGKHANKMGFFQLNCSFAEKNNFMAVSRENTHSKSVTDRGRQTSSGRLRESGIDLE